MASVDWKKATTQKASAMIKHNGKMERIKNGHANIHIDKSKSHLNMYIGASDYRLMYDKVKARIDEVDKLYPPKKDMGSKRITCILLETPVPEAVENQGKAKEFLLDAHKVIEEFFGKENVGGSVCHFDEQHKYLDSKTGEEKKSLIHMHTLCCAYAEWTDTKKDKKTGKIIAKTERKGINGKNCETLARLHALNDKMHKMCVEKYGVDYNTYETPQRKSVERLKNESELKQETLQLQAEHKAIQDSVMEYAPPQKNFLETNKAYEERSKVYQEMQLIKEKEVSQQRLQAELQAREQAIRQQEEDYEKRKRTLDTECTQAYSKGYEIGIERGKQQQIKADNGKINALEKQIADINAKYNNLANELNDLKEFCDTLTYGEGSILDAFNEQQEQEEQEEREEQGYIRAEDFF